jgi:hypothetical protein
MEMDLQGVTTTSMAATALEKLLAVMISKLALWQIFSTDERSHSIALSTASGDEHFLVMMLRELRLSITWSKVSRIVSRKKEPLTSSASIVAFMTLATDWDEQAHLLAISKVGGEAAGVRIILSTMRSVS